MGLTDNDLMIGSADEKKIHRLRLCSFVEGLKPFPDEGQNEQFD